MIVFRPLDAEAFAQITEAQLTELQNRWHNHIGIKIEFAPEVASTVAAYCHHKNQASQDREGGRLVRHTLKSTLEASLLDYVRSTTQPTTVTVSSQTDTPPATLAELKASFRFSSE